MISAIKMVNCVPFRNEEISDCKKVNFIFGSNGSGKSTICSFLNGKDDERFAESTKEWYTTEHETIYVYNRDFRTRNIKEKIPGVFTLGSATIDQINEIEELKKDLNFKRDYLESLSRKYYEQVNTVKPKREKLFKDEAWTFLYKSVDPQLQKAFEGLRNSKDNFFDEVIKRISGRETKGNICDEKDLITRAKTLFAPKPQKCGRLEYDITSNIEKISQIKSDPIWNTVIAGNEDVDIAKLIKDLGNSSWVNQGRKFIVSGSSVCPFCQQETVTDSFRQKLEAFFDKEYNSRIEKMELYLSEYSQNATEIYDTFNTLSSAKESIDVGKVDLDTFSKALSNYKEQYSDNIDLIKSKISEPGIKVEIKDLSLSIGNLSKIFDNANSFIDEQNLLIDQKKDEESKLIDDIWATNIHNSKARIETYKSDMRSIDKAIRGLDDSKKQQQNLVTELELDIVKKEQNVTSIEPAINNINNLLKAYGFTSFYVDASDDEENCYCIKRNDGTIVNDSLSEGEETFLTFLYFMQYVKGTNDPETIAENKIIVLDDPISSLDSTILYVVSSMVRSLSEDIRKGNGDVKQLFVFTHNVLFHKEASYLYRNQENQDVKYWIIKKGEMISSITSYGSNNPISTSYELLWKELRENDSISHIALQNIMRRILENYFRLVGKDKYEQLLDNLKTEEDKIIGRSLFFWMNEGSHNIPDDLFNNSYTDDITKYKAVFKEIFCENGHEEHYNMMMNNH